MPASKIKHDSAIVPSVAQSFLGDAICARLGVTPLLANFPAKTIWRYFWHLLAAAFLLRVGIALSSDWVYRLDEILEHLEQAHRFIFGYGVVPWEYSYGTRNWLHVLPAATTLKLFQMVGLEHPDYYIPAVKIVNAALSMAIPAGLYFFLRRHISEIAARAGFIFCCFWWEFMLLAPHTLAEQYGGILIAGGLGCMATQAKTFRLSCCGFLLGLAIMMRPQYAPVVALFGLFFLLQLSPRRMPPFILGGVAATVLAGWLDYVFWGGWWFSYFQYLRLIIATNFFAGDTEMPSIALFLKMFFFSSLSLHAFLFFFGVLHWRKYWLPLLSLAILLLIHTKHTILHAYYSHFFLSFIMFAVVFGGVMASLAKKKSNFILSGLAVALISIVGLFNWLPTITGRFHGHLGQQETPSFLYQEQQLAVTKTLSRLPKKQVKSVLWSGGNPLFTGLYYYLHHQVPVYYLYYDFQKQHRKIINDSRLPAAKLFSHIVALSDQTFEGFRAIKKFPGKIDISIFENISANDIWIPEKFALNKPARLDDYLKNHSPVIPPVFLPPRED